MRVIWNYVYSPFILVDVVHLYVYVYCVATVNTKK